MRRNDGLRMKKKKKKKPKLKVIEYFPLLLRLFHIFRFFCGIFAFTRVLISHIKADNDLHAVYNETDSLFSLRFFTSKSNKSNNRNVPAAIESGTSDRPMNYFVFIRFDCCKFIFYLTLAFYEHFNIKLFLFIFSMAHSTGILLSNRILWSWWSVTGPFYTTIYFILDGSQWKGASRLDSSITSR